MPAYIAQIMMRFILLRVMLLGVIRIQNIKPYRKTEQRAEATFFHHRNLPEWRIADKADGFRFVGKKRCCDREEGNIQSGKLYIDVQFQDSCWTQKIGGGTTKTKSCVRCSTLYETVKGTSSRCAEAHPWQLLQECWCTDMDAMASLAQLVPGRKNNLHTN